MKALWLGGRLGWRQRERWQSGMTGVHGAATALLLQAQRV